MTYRLLNMLAGVLALLGLGLGMTTRLHYWIEIPLCLASGIILSLVGRAADEKARGL